MAGAEWTWLRSRIVTGSSPIEQGTAPQSCSPGVAPCYLHVQNALKKLREH